MMVAYIIALGFTFGLLINRNAPLGEAMPVITSGDSHANSQAQAVSERPVWLQVFRPSQRAARMMLRMGLPILVVADGSAQEMANRNLLYYWTGHVVERPQTFFQAMLPFLRPEPTVAEAPPAANPPKQTPAPQPVQPAQPPPESTTPSTAPATPEVANGTKLVVNGGLPLVGIYHTHDWESYVSEFPALALKAPRDLQQIRSEDHKVRTVLELGHAIAVKLQAKGITTIHAPFRHSADGYDAAYVMSRETAKQILKEAPSVRILLDIHRDAAWNYDPTTVIDGQRTAQIRCIIEKAAGPKVDPNRKFCEALMQTLEKKHPGLTLATRVQGKDYNQDLAPGAVLLEIGNATSRYAEAERAVLLLADGLADLIRSGSFPH